MNHYFNLRACNMEKAPSKSEESPMERTYDHLTDVDETIHVGLLSVALAPDSSQKECSRSFYHNESKRYQLLKKLMLASAVASIVLGLITSIALFSKKPPNAPQLPSSEQQTGGHDNFVDLVGDNDESPQQSNALSQEDGGRVPTLPLSSEHKNAWVYDIERETSSPTENASG